VPAIPLPAVDSERIAATESVIRPYVRRTAVLVSGGNTVAVDFERQKL